MTKSWANPHTGGVSSMTDVVQISMTRDQLSVYHRALSCAIDHVEEARGTESKVSFLAAIVELSDAAMVAIYQHDRIPKSEWDPGVCERYAKARSKAKKETTP